MSLGFGKKAAAVVVPWVFIAVFAALYVGLFVPRLRDGSFIAICFGVFIALVFVSFLVAAVTFSRDVLLGRWPERSAD